MTEKETLKTLKSMGTAQNRKIYKRHGVDGEIYGVSYANLKELKKKIKIDHELALKLWASGNHDARVFATMIVDPNRMSQKTIDAWAKGLSNYVITGAFAGAVGKTERAAANAARWTKVKDEWKSSAGWSILARLALDDTTMKDGDFVSYLATIEKEIHTRGNRVRYSMNNALIAIGARSSKLEKKALAVAKKIGKVEVDHGETGCKTRDAASYIPKARARQAKRVGRA